MENSPTDTVNTIQFYLFGFYNIILALSVLVLIFVTCTHSKNEVTYLFTCFNRELWTLRIAKCLILQKKVNNQVTYFENTFNLLGEGSII